MHDSYVEHLYIQGDTKKKMGTSEKLNKNKRNQIKKMLAETDPLEFAF